MFTVAIDARSADSPRSGIGNYTTHLISELARLDSEFQLLLIRRANPQASPSLDIDSKVRVESYRGDTKSVSTLGLGISLAKVLRNVDLYHSPADIVPLGLPCPWVVTLHDLMWVETPELCSSFLPVRLVNSLWYRWNFSRSVPGAASIIAISRATADAIARVYPQQRDKVHVVHHGVDHERYSSKEQKPRSLLDPYLPRGMRYSLIVGQGSPYKNHLGMVRAFAEAMKDRSDHKLVLVRRFSRVDKEMHTLLERPEVKQKLISVPFVPDDVLLALYQHAHMLLFVSHNEGFGLPALEAMALGTPVLASTAPAVVEVTGEGALHVSSTDPSSMARGIVALDSDEALRERLQKAGLQRSREFSWKRAAEQTLAAYRSALRGR